MPTQNLDAVISGESVMTVDRIESPRWLSADLDNTSDLVAWLATSPLPGAELESQAAIEFAHLGVGASLDLVAGIVISSSLRLTVDADMADLSVGVGIGGSIRFIAGGNELTGLSASAAISADLGLASPVAIYLRQD